MRQILIFLIAIFITLITLGGGLYYYDKVSDVKKISSFKECAAAGYPIMESYPARCMTPDKRSFTQEISPEEQKKLIPPSDRVCTDTCGNGTCEEIVCMGSDCPCAETPKTCPKDCQ